MLNTKRVLAVALITGAAAMAPLTADAWWGPFGGWAPWDDGWGGGPWGGYPYGGYPYYGYGGYPGYGYGGYPGYGYGGYPGYGGYGGYGGYPGYGYGGYPGYAAPAPQEAPAAPADQAQ